jgi:hypothetical protein
MGHKGGCFRGKLFLKDSDKPITIGWCMFPGGTNRWSVEYDKDGKFKEIRWFNIAPAGKNKKERDDNKKAILEELEKHPIPRNGSTGAQDEKTTLEALKKIKDRLSVKEKKGKITVYETVMWFWDGKKLVGKRLQDNDGNLEFVEDPTIKLKPPGDNAEGR